MRDYIDLINEKSEPLLERALADPNQAIEFMQAHSSRYGTVTFPLSIPRFAWTDGIPEAVSKLADSNGVEAHARVKKGILYHTLTVSVEGTCADMKSFLEKLVQVISRVNA